MRIIQVCDGISPGDAIGNHILALHDYFEKKGYTSFVFSNSIHPKLEKIVKPYNKYVENRDDVIIYHLGIGNELNRKIVRHKCKIILNYHNITPPRYFEGYNNKLFEYSKLGYEDLEYLKDKVDAVISDSDYNNIYLRKIEYTCPLYHVPIILKFDDYKNKPDQKLQISLSQKKEKLIIFVGRIAPNKKYEDIILDFYYYNKIYNSDSKLVLVGSYNNFEGYYLKLNKFVKKLSLKHKVIFTGHISFSQILAYYNNADLMICESEHEGFCVPLVEAMLFNIPTLAYNSSAIKETLGDVGIIFNEKNPKITATIMDLILRDELLQKEIQRKQKERLLKFNNIQCALEYEKIILGLLDNCDDSTKNV